MFLKTNFIFYIAATFVYLAHSAPAVASEKPSTLEERQAITGVKRAGDALAVVPRTKRQRTLDSDYLPEADPAAK